MRILIPVTVLLSPGLEHIIEGSEEIIPVLK